MTFIFYVVFIFLAWLLNLFLKERYRFSLLLIVSLFFICTFNFASCAAIVLIGLFNYVVALALPSQKNSFLFSFSVGINIFLILAVNTLSTNKDALNIIPENIGFDPSAIVILVGLTFYCLQHIAYLIDVWKKRIEPEKNLLAYLFVCVYFPKVVSGPLTLYQDIAPRLKAIKPTASLSWQGFNRVLLGLFKKVVIADRLAPSVASVFDYGDELPGLTVFAGALLFTIQLYFDFSGYSDIAIGISKMMGIELMENFNFPLRATSITVFWRKWHRSLIRFFTTYIFLPVSFKLRTHQKAAAAAGITVTFICSGLWHGLGFGFLIWASCHCVFLLTELFTVRNIALREKRGLPVKVFYVLIVIVLVTFSNIFFRAKNTQDYVLLISELFSLDKFFPVDWLVEFTAPMAVGGHQTDLFNFFVTLFLAGIALLFERKLFQIFSTAGFRPFATYAILLLIFIFGVLGNGQRFIYMQF